MSEIPFNKAQSYYLLVGVGKREDDREAMAVSAQDAVTLQRALHAFDLFSNKKFSPLINEQATRAGILAQLDALAEETAKNPADLVLLFFSGHGSKAGDDYYLICNDTQNESIETTAIEGALFVEKLKAIECDKMLVLLDCCHAAGMTDMEVPFDEASKESLLKQKNRVILTACAKNQLSYLSKPVSLFTYALIEGLAGKLLNEGDTEVNVFNLAMDVRERVAALSAKALKLDQPQKPQLNVLPESSTTNFALARYPLGGLKEIKVLGEELTSLKTEDGKKEITTSVTSDPDEGYRNKFSWMMTSNIIQNIGNGNYIVQGQVVNNGIAAEQLKEVLYQLGLKDNTINKLTEELIAALKNRNDRDSKDLLTKVEAARDLRQQEITMLEESRTLLKEKLFFLTRSEIISSDPLQKFSLKKEMEQINKQIADINNQLSKLQ